MPDFFDSLSNTPDSDPSERVRLKVLGLSYSQIRNGAYALILAEADGPIRIPVVIGAGEAQAIAIKMEGIVTPRPMTHDLFSALGHAFGIELSEVFIYRFEDGVFYSELTFTDGDRTVKLDSRTSDAVAIAMRTGAPIYTTRQILLETGFEMEITELPTDNDSSSATSESGEFTPRDDSAATSQRSPRLENYSLEELRRTLEKLIDREQYEEASRVTEIIRRKEQQAAGIEPSENSDTTDPAPEK